MGKFKFSLESVRRFKARTLDTVKIEYAQALDAVTAQKMCIATLRQDYLQHKEEFDQKREKGLSVLEYNGLQSNLLYIQDNIEDALEKLGSLERHASLVKNRMIQAKIESASIDTIREQRLDEFKESERKKEDLFIEEFVSNKRSRS